MPDVLRTRFEIEGIGTYLGQVARVEGAYRKVADQQERATTATRNFGALWLITGAALAAGLTRAVAAAGAFEARVIAFNQVFKRGEGFSRQFVGDLQKFSLQTSFSANDMITYAQRLRAMGFQAEEIIPTLKTLTDTVSATGGGRDELDRIVLAFGQIRTRGKLAQQEVNQLTQANIPAFEILQRKLGLTGQQMGELGRQGIVSSVALKALTEGLNETFGGAQQAQLNTLSGKLGQVGNLIGQILIKIGEPLLDVVIPGLRLVVNILDSVNTLLDSGVMKWGSWIAVAASAFALFKGFAWLSGQIGGASMIMQGMGVSAMGVLMGGVEGRMAQRMGIHAAIGEALGAGGAAGTAARTGGRLVVGAAAAETAEAAVGSAAATSAAVAAMARAPAPAVGRASRLGGLSLTAMGRGTPSTGFARYAGMGIGLGIMLGASWLVSQANSEERASGVPGAVGVLGNALGGAVMGASFGAGFGPWGALAGGAIGALAGGAIGYMGMNQGQDEVKRNIADISRNTATLVDQNADMHQARVVAGGEDLRRPFPDSRLQSVLHAL